MKITVVGLGYVGLANAALLSREHQVVALDTNAERVLAVNSGHSTVDDADMDEWLMNQPLNLWATVDPRYAYPGASYIVIAVPTSYDESTGQFDTSIVESVISDARRYAPSATIVIRSTVPVGFTADMAGCFPDTRFLFVPEFLREGHALLDTLNPSRIIIGAPSIEDDQFGRLLDQHAGIGYTIMPWSEAEAVKLFSNTYLAMRVAFFNELDTFALAHGLDASTLIEGVSKDPRIGQGYNNPSFGYGGYCLPKDTKQLRANYDLVPQTLISAIIESNETRKKYIANDILDRSPGVVGIYRLVMKAGSANWRDSAIIDVIGYLNDAGVEVLIYEPELTEDNFHGNKVIDHLNEFTSRCDLIVSNRIDPQIAHVWSKVYTRDIFGKD